MLHLYKEGDERTRALVPFFFDAGGRQGLATVAVVSEVAEV